MLCKVPSKEFTLKYFPREPEWSFDLGPNIHKFGVDVFIHFIHNNKNRPPYVLVYDKTLEWSLAVDIKKSIIYGHNKYLFQSEIEVLLNKLLMNKEHILLLWKTKNIDEQEWIEGLI